MRKGPGSAQNSSSTRIDSVPTEGFAGSSYSGQDHTSGGGNSTARAVHPLSTAAALLAMTPAKSSNGFNYPPTDNSSASTSRNHSTLSGGAGIVRASTPVQQSQPSTGQAVPTTPQRQIQPSVILNSNSSRHGPFNPFFRSSNVSSIGTIPSSSNAFVSFAGSAASSSGVVNPATSFNRPVRLSSLHQMTLPQTPDSSPVSPMSFDTPGGIHTPTMNAPSQGVFPRDSQPFSNTSYFNGSGPGTANTNRHTSGWPLARTRSQDSPTATFNFGPSSSVSSLGLESGFMLDRSSEKSSSSDEEYTGDYDSDDLMSMGSRRQSLSTPHFMPVFRSDTNSSSSSSVATKLENDSSQSQDLQEIIGPSRRSSFRRMSTASEPDSGHHNTDGSALKNFFSNFRPDTKRSLLGGTKKSSLMSPMFGLSRKDEHEPPSTPSKGKGFASKRMSSILPSKRVEESVEQINEVKAEPAEASPSSNRETSTESTAAIRRFVSDGRSLRPKVKSFMRISRDLQDEMSPQDCEIKQEARITNALRDDGSTDLYGRHPFNSVGTSYQAPPSAPMNFDSGKGKTVAGKNNSPISSAFAPIQQTQRQKSISRSDSMKSNSADMTDSETMNSPGSTPTKLATASLVAPSVKRKASIMEDSEPAFLKRRAVSPGYVSPVVSSPTSGSLGNKRNIKHLRDTSDGFEKMSLA